MTDRRIVLVGDELGLPQLEAALPSAAVAGVVVASIRPDSWDTGASVAARLDVPMLVQPRAGAPEFEEFRAAIGGLGAGVLVVNSYSMLIPADVLGQFDTAVNIHAALLPEYRGANPIQWAIIHDESVAGVTMHHMTDAFDEGDVVDVERVPILMHDTWVEVRDRLMAATDDLLARQAPRIVAGDLPGTPQDPSRARTFRRRKPEDGVLDWDQPVLANYHLIRALVAPHPGVTFDRDGSEVHLTGWIPISDVANLKAEALGGSIAFPEGACRDFVGPEGDRQAQLAALGFRVVSNAGDSGLVHLTEIDWTARVALGAADPDDAAGERAIRSVAEAFARQEIGLSVRW